MRLDRVPLSTRVLAALRVGELTTPQLEARLGKRSSSRIHAVLRELQAAGFVTRTSKGRESSWALTHTKAPADAQDDAIRNRNDGQDYAGD